MSLTLVAILSLPFLPWWLHICRPFHFLLASLIIPSAGLGASRDIKRHKFSALSSLSELCSVPKWETTEIMSHAHINVSIKTFVTSRFKSFCCEHQSGVELKIVKKPHRNGLNLSIRDVSVKWIVSLTKCCYPLCRLPFKRTQKVDVPVSVVCIGSTSYMLT